jgi:hypothetical protein
MGQKFTSLLGQASVFSFTAAAGIFTLADRLKVRYPHSLWVALPSVVGLAMYAVIIIKYFLQIRYTGGIMLKIEAGILAGEAKNLGLLHVLRDSPSAFYKQKWTFALVFLYALMLVFLPLAAVWVVP